MRKYVPHIALFVIWFLLADLIQSFEFFGPNVHWARWRKIYVGAHLLLMTPCAWVLWKDARRKDGLIQRTAKAIRMLPMSIVAKVVLGALFLVQMAYITLGRTNYPFADVGMFRWHKEAKALDPVLTLPKYYYRNAEGHFEPLEIRKQHIWAFADLLGWGYNNEYTFSVAYHYKAQRATYEHLLTALEREAGIDTLWLGLQTVDFRTGEVRFDIDTERANAFVQKNRIFYGPTHIPGHQLSRRHE